MESSSIKAIPIEDIVPSVANGPITATLVTARRRSWVFRIYDAAEFALSRFFGIVSVVFCTAVAANIPVLQLLSFGYLLEVSGRIGRGGKLSSAMVGLSKASRIGGIILGTWLLLIPIRFFSDAFWYEAYLIDPSSSQTRFLRIVQIVLIVLTVVQIAAAWICGGKLRYFFWQLFAPFSFGLWAFRKMIGSRLTRPVLSFCLSWISPELTDDLCNAKPPADWFVPAIVWKKIRNRNVYISARDGLWNFVSDLNLWSYFKLGLGGFIGTIVWLFVPTLLLIGATTLTGPAAILSGTTGFILAIPIFILLPYLQTHYARSQNIFDFFDLKYVMTNVRRAPFAHVVSLLLVLLFALPLFLLKVEKIPAELLWTLSIVFVAFSWPSRIVTALAYRRGAKKAKVSRWWISWPIISLAIPISAAFVVILFFTRYISWHGAASLIENHVFLLPAPFWL